MMRASENDCESDGEREIVRGAVREGCERWRTGVNVRGRSRAVVNDHVIDETIELWRFNYGGKSLQYSKVGPSPCDPYRQALTMRPSLKARPLVS